MSDQRTITFTTDWATMPPTATFDELLTWKGIAGYVDNGYSYSVIFLNGVVYYGTIDQTTARRCDASERIDPVFLTGR